MIPPAEVLWDGRRSAEARVAIVLIAEDEFGIAKLLEDVLEDEGHRVLVASNGQRALELAGKDTPSLVLTDFMMPIMDGGALVRALSNDPVLADVPVIVMSSLPEEAIAERCKGYTLFIRKPFKIIDVIDAVAKLSAITGAESDGGSPS